MKRGENVWKDGQANAHRRMLCLPNSMPHLGCNHVILIRDISIILVPYHDAKVSCSSLRSLSISTTRPLCGWNRRSFISIFRRRCSPLKDRSRESCPYVEQYFLYSSCPLAVGSSSLVLRIPIVSTTPQLQFSASL